LERRGKATGRRLAGWWNRAGMLLLVLTLAVSTGAVGCGRQGRERQAAVSKDRPVVRIAYLPITHSLPLAVAHMNTGGTFENFNLEPVKFSSWPELTEALHSGKIQGAITMLELTLVGRQKGFPLKVVALSHRNGDVMVVRPEIGSVAELKGRRVAIPHRLSGHNILLYIALQDAGLKYSDIQVVEMPPPDMMAALYRGEVDAYLVAEPFGAAAVAQGVGRVLLRAQDIWEGWICCGLAVREEFLNHSPDAVAELVKALLQAGEEIHTDPQKAIAASTSYFGHREDLMALALGWICYEDLVPQVQEFERLQDYLVAMGLMKERVNLRELVDDRWAKGYSPRSGSSK